MAKKRQRTRAKRKTVAAAADPPPSAPPESAAADQVDRGEFAVGLVESRLCGGCCSWDAIDGGECGECLARPPVRLTAQPAASSVNSGFPVTRRGQCGCRLWANADFIPIARDDKQAAAGGGVSPAVDPPAADTD